MIAPIPVIQADIFTTQPFAGNPAAAVLDAEHLDEAAMQRIAGEMLVPGTAFVSAPRGADADWRLRMFTPKRPVAYSGHTALCATHALVEAGRVPGARVTFDTPAGRLRVEIERGKGPALMWLEPPLPACTVPDHDVIQILDAIGLPRAGLAGWARPAVSSCGEGRKDRGRGDRRTEVEGLRSEIVGRRSQIADRGPHSGRGSSRITA